MAERFRPDPADGRPALALVHHGHQHLVVDGYDNHEGLSELLESYTAVLALHLKHRIPLNLHLSGTLVEAIAWRGDDFFGWVEALAVEGLVELIGSAYAQPILGCFSDEHNRRQIAEELRLHSRHLGVDPAAIGGFWVPERVWHTERLAALIADPTLVNGGYRYVLLDDRLAYSAANSERTAFDAASAPGRSMGPASGCGSPTHPPASLWALPGRGDERSFRPAMIEGGCGLIGVPISGNLRYAIPPRSTKNWHELQATLSATADAGPGAVAVYADDLEKAAAVGPWTSGAWIRENVLAYEQLLAWIGENGRATPVLLGSFLSEHAPQLERPFDPGTFYELVAGGAGEDYSAWWGAADYAPFRAYLTDVESRLLRESASAESAERATAAGGLVDLAWKQLMVGAYETAWRGLRGPDHEVAPWARATASHCRSAYVTLEAEHYRRCLIDLSRVNGRPHRDVWVADIDQDGEVEVIFADERSFGVVSPCYGGRLVAAFDLRSRGGRQVVGNPADDWNWQEEVNRWMEIPSNHPGAFTDCGFENARWDVVAISRAEVKLRCVEAASSLAGSTKSYRYASPGVVEVEYRLAGSRERFDVEMGLSPDYLRLLREGHEALQSVHTPSRRGVSAGQCSVWVELPAGEPLVWASTPARPAGHVVGLRVSAHKPVFRLRLGIGTRGELEAHCRGARMTRRLSTGLFRKA